MNDRPRIARVLPALDFGGIESVVVLQAQEHDPRQYELHVVAMHDDGRAAESIRQAGVPVHILGEHPAIRNPRATNALAHKLRALDADIVHGSAGEGMVHSALAGNWAGSRVILEEQGVPRRSLKSRPAFAALYRLADAIVVVSEAVRQWMHESEWLPLERTWLIYNCPQPRFFAPLARTWDTTGRAFRFLATGRFVPQKNMELLLEALSGLMAKERDAELWIAGDGPLREQLEQRTRDLGLGDRVRFLGYREDVPTLLDQCDAYVFASRREGSSNALMEALARGTPTIASNIPENMELVASLGDEWLLSPDDSASWVNAMARLVDMPSAERRSLGEYGRRLAEEHFSPKAYLKSLEDMYRTVQAQPVRRVMRALGNVRTTLAS